MSPKGNGNLFPKSTFLNQYRISDWLGESRKGREVEVRGGVTRRDR